MAAPGSAPFLTSNSNPFASGVTRQGSAPLLASPAGSFVIGQTAPAAPTMSTTFSAPTMPTPVPTFAGPVTPTPTASLPGVPPASTIFAGPVTPTPTMSLPGTMTAPPAAPPASTTFAGPVTPTPAASLPGATTFVTPGSEMAAATAGVPQSTAGVPPGVPPTARLPPPSSLPPGGPEYKTMAPQTMGPQEMMPFYRSTPANSFGTANSFGRPSFNSMPPLGRPSMNTMPPGTMPIQIGPTVTIQISSLLDMDLYNYDPVFKIRIRDDEEYQLYVTDDIEGIPEGQSGPDPDKHNIGLGPFGVIFLETLSPLLYVQVEHAGLLGSTVGRCQIHRLDPRSAQLWPYALSDRNNRPVGGIQLRVVEGGPPAMPPPMGAPPMMTGPPPPMMTTPPMGPPPMMTGPAMPMQTMPPPVPMQTTPRPSMTSGRPSTASVVQNPLEDIVASLTLDEVTDLPAPTQRQDLELTIESDNGHHVGAAGPYHTQQQGQSNLHTAKCNNQQLNVKAPFQTGGDSRDGAMFIIIVANYVAQRVRPEPIGKTLPIMVSWNKTQRAIHELVGPNGQPIGSVKLNYMLTHEKAAKDDKEQGEIKPPNAPEMVQQPARAIVPTYTRGRTGHFPPGSQEEAIEQACLNFEVQNRANHQRVMIADPTVYENGMNFRTVNGYREWDSLDSLFGTLGPNPILQSEEVGPSLTRAYQDRTALFTEVEKKMRQGLPPRPLTPLDKEIDAQLLRTMYPGNPYRVEQNLRPVACKNPDAIAEYRDMSWCPDPPMYAPLRNMGEEDKETLRLAQYAPNQCAKLWFADCNPNYVLSEDIWGAIADNRAANAAFMRTPEHYRPRRVKDDCLMA